MSDPVRRVGLLSRAFETDWEGAAPRQKPQTAFHAGQPDFVRPGRFMATMQVGAGAGGAGGCEVGDCVWGGRAGEAGVSNPKFGSKPATEDARSFHTLTQGMRSRPCAGCLSS